MILNHRWSQKEGVTVTRNPKNGLQIFEEVSPSHISLCSTPARHASCTCAITSNSRRVISAAVDGKKLPGLAGRYGDWDRRATTRPTMVTAAARRQDCITRTGYSGWSMRARALPGRRTPTLRASVVPVTYAYQAAMVGPYGDTGIGGRRMPASPC